MADKMFDRAFSKALSRQKRAFEKSDEERPLTEEQKQTIENERLRKESQPMTVEDAIKRMLLADIDKDYFRSSFLLLACIPFLSLCVFFGKEETGLRDLTIWIEARITPDSSSIF